MQKRIQIFISLSVICATWAATRAIAWAEPPAPTPTRAIAPKKPSVETQVLPGQAPGTGDHGCKDSEEQKKTMQALERH